MLQQWTGRSRINIAACTVWLWQDRGGSKGLQQQTCPFNNPSSSFHAWKEAPASVGLAQPLESDCGRRKQAAWALSNMCVLQQSE